MMRAHAMVLPVGLVLAGCEAAPEPAPTPSERVSANVPVSDTVAKSAQGPLSATDLRRVCRAGLASVHGQDVDAVQVDSLEGSVVNASWRAPVDGGRMRAQCRVDGDLITWKPVDRPVAEQNRWMNQSGDPVVRFVLDDAAVTVTTTLPDGTTSTQDYAVVVQEEAR
ncbi:hypothetical protein KOAAANKH_02229 [Brevundimonas sp. NIBR10]|uniref:hypothetical protein n=1 Tax=Brevundimonas sp. NIBR10 TaxID=3015997 RepID=UPI0022F1CB5B|nr:hypothetical protein [Brevundimonas sp. NIBR10]WGM47353.1 hypothetical protein KOAAANKH_02229 [Brevundimonas sp. NIBR10]